MAIFKYNKFIFIILVSCSISVFGSPPHKTSQPAQQLMIKILGINDFHGQVSSGRRVNDRPAGSAAVLASYLKQAQTGMENNTIITMMGDQVGASPPVSGLLNDEPTIIFLNILANKHCRTDDRMNPQCNMVATVGNHEFDKGQKAMFDLIYGTDKPPTDSWIPLPNYPGASFPYISANIVDAKTKKNIFPAYVIKNINGIQVAFIGAISKNAPDVIVSSNIEGVEFLDEAESINKYIPEIKAKGAEVIVVIIHEGGIQKSYEGSTQNDITVEGRIAAIVNKLDDNIDVVMAGHVHQFINAMLTNAHGKKILVTEANSYSTAFSEITLLLDPKSHAIIHKSARIITTYANQLPGTTPDPEAERIVKLAEEKVAPIYNREIGTLQKDLMKKENADGESAMGDLIADAFRKAMNSDIAFFNRGGIRNDLYAGKVTWGNLYSVLPFSNYSVKILLKGKDILDLLEQQWSKSIIETLQVSGLSYVYDLEKPPGERIISISHDNKPLEKDKTYTVCINNFLATGGDGFTVFKRGLVLARGMTDLEALIAYVKSLPQPFSIVTEGRIQKKIN